METIENKKNMKNMKKVSLLVILLCSIGVNAQNPQLLYDIEPGATPSYPHEYLTTNDKLYFNCQVGTVGYELWSYDGINPPVQEFDLNSGAGGSNPEALTAFNGNIVGRATDGSNGIEMFMYDGVNPPTFYDLNPGIDNSIPDEFIELNGKLYFKAFTNSNGDEVWEFDGVNPPTQLPDINTAPNAGSNPYDFFVHNDTLFFSATDGINGQELWAYSGSGSPFLVENINLTSGGAGDAFPCCFISYDDVLYFVASDGVNDTELWSYDMGVVSLVDDINPTGAGWPYRMTVFANQLLFYATDGVNGYELWSYQTGNSTANMVADINPGSGSSYPTPLGVINDTLYFTAEDGISWGGSLIWKYDGTNPPTLVADLSSTGALTATISNEKVTFNNRIYFGASDWSSTGNELYEFDGVNYPTLHELNPGIDSSYPEHFTIYNNALYFTAIGVSSGKELWKICFPNTNTITTEACNEYTVPSGSYTVSSSGQYMDTVSNIAGCDSVITINLSIYQPSDLDLSVSQTGITLTANASNASYQWLDCDNGYAEIAGATNQSYTPQQNGNYAVAITEGCTDTSNCININNVGINEFSEQLLTIAPNPNNGSFKLLLKSSNLIGIQLIDFNGRLIQDLSEYTESSSIEVSDIETGVYFLKVQSINAAGTYRMIVNN